MSPLPLGAMSSPRMLSPGTGRHCSVSGRGDAVAVAGPGDGLSPQPLAVPWSLPRAAGLPRLQQHGAGAGSVLELAPPPVAVHTNEVAIPAPRLRRVLPHKHLPLSGHGSRLGREVPGGWVVRGAAS